MDNWRIHRLWNESLSFRPRICNCLNRIQSYTQQHSHISIFPPLFANSGERKKRRKRRGEPAEQQIFGKAKYYFCIKKYLSALDHFDYIRCSAQIPSEAESLWMSSPPEYFLTVTGTDMENGGERRWHEYFCGIEHQSMLRGAGRGGTVARPWGLRLYYVGDKHQHSPHSLFRPTKQLLSEKKEAKCLLRFDPHKGNNNKTNGKNKMEYPKYFSAKKKDPEWHLSKFMLFARNWNEIL